MTKQNEDYAKSWELLTDSERAELLKPEAWIFDDETKSQCDDSVSRLTCFLLNLASGFVGFLAGWYFL